MGSDKLSETYMRQQTGDDEVLVKKVSLCPTHWSSKYSTGDKRMRIGEEEDMVRGGGS